MDYIKPEKSHEDNLKVELAKWAQQSGLHLHMEYTFGKCRFDCVLVRSDNILAIIEIKNWDNKRAFYAKKSPDKQLRKYLRHEVPVYVLWSFNGCKALVKTLRKRANKFDESGIIAEAVLRFFPNPRKTKRGSELRRLIKQQAHDIHSVHAGNYDPWNA